jgi:serine/threonine protein kinase
VVHRDLKPENVLVNLENSGNYMQIFQPRRIIAVKIADFGVSKTKEANITCSGQTTGTGTTLYMAPEVLKVGVDDPDKAKFNPRKVDVFSFAIMCSVILTGKGPYHDCGLGLGQKKRQVREGTLRPTLPAYCLPELASLIRKCWAGNPSERPFFDEICRELRRIKSSLLCERGR